MAQFQILCPHSDTEWRPITIEFCFAPTGDQQYLWPPFEDAEAARQQLLLRVPDARLRVALAGANIGDVDWQVREKLRFADGSYEPTPWHDEPWYQAKHDEHFCHISTEQAGKIAFTENSAKGQLDRQLVMSPGRYLHRFFSNDLDNNAIEGWCARLSVQLQEDALKITQDADEIEDVYVGGPSSCMAHDASDFESFCHPARIYAGPDTALAYIGAREDARARSVVWPERKIHTSIYGDVSRLKLLLEAAGYREGGLNGARVRRIVDGDSFVVPYIDAGGDLADDGEYLIIGRGNIPSENTNGLGDQCWYCPRCDHSSTAHDTVYYSDGSSEEWCYGCFTDRTIFCAYNECSYSNAETFVTVLADDDEHDVLERDVEAFGAVYLEDRGEWWVSGCCRRCDASGDWFHLDDLTEYHGEWLCDDHLPEPFDDDDPSLVNAHVLALHRFRDEMAAIAVEVAKWQAAGNRARDERLKREREDAGSPQSETPHGTACDPESDAASSGDHPDRPPLSEDLLHLVAAQPATATAHPAGA
ncbi:hypothetical protein [Sphingopyxis sp. JAI108]|uniref:hypothetical protein n=1 Tax=Sphingopyxis sp. JAI108 TaxID=2723060 RepID=UPI0015CDDAA0|nr:hypothetical protein [Sphingopyxis sp. JAI108]NYF30654.1 hypothetical protein [Sphingopyxis sp. JAI108]